LVLLKEIIGGRTLTKMLLKYINPAFYIPFEQPKVDFLGTIIKKVQKEFETVCNCYKNTLD
jgi:hypothetical protein